MCVLWPQRIATYSAVSLKAGSARISIFRLTGLVFRLPPLRERTGDVPILAEILLDEIAGQMGKLVPKLSNEALRALVEHEWKGNVREFRHCLEQAIALNDGPLLSKESLRLDNESTPHTGRAKPSQILPDPASNAAVLNCLRQQGFDMQATAQTLGWHRSTVTQRLKGLCFHALVETHGDKAQAAATLAGDPSLTRTVELKLMDYYDHLVAMIQPFATVRKLCSTANGDSRTSRIGISARWKHWSDNTFAATQQFKPDRRKVPSLSIRQRPA